MKKAIGYIRVSTQDQATEGVSLEAQKAKIAAWCEVNDYELVAVFSDAGISGASMDGREGLKAALKATSKGSALVAYSISRLARSTRDMLDIADLLEKRGADLVSLTEKIDTTSAAGKMIFRMLAVMSEFERDVIAERTRTALAHKKATAQVYGPTPFGFDAVEGRLREVRAEARIVAEVIRRRQQGDTLASIADDLNRRGVAGKRGGRWYPSTVKYLLERQAA